MIILLFMQKNSGNSIFSSSSKMIHMTHLYISALSDKVDIYTLAAIIYLLFTSVIKGQTTTKNKQGQILQLRISKILSKFYDGSTANTL